MPKVFHTNKMYKELKVLRSASAVGIPASVWGIKTVLLKVREKREAVRGFIVRIRRAGAQGLIFEQGIEVVNKIGEWSEMHGMENTSVTETVTPSDNTRSSVWPFSCVGTVTD